MSTIRIKQHAVNRLINRFSTSLTLPRRGGGKSTPPALGQISDMIRMAYRHGIDIVNRKRQRGRLIIRECSIQGETVFIIASSKGSETHIKTIFTKSMAQQSGYASASA